MDFLIHHLLERSAERWPAKEALVDGDQRLSYRDVARFTHGIAIGLRRAGLVRGDRIGICLEPSSAQVLSIFAISESGGISVPINARLFPERRAHRQRLRHEGLDHYTCQALHLGRGSPAASRTRLRDLDG